MVPRALVVLLALAVPLAPLACKGGAKKDPAGSASASTAAPVTKSAAVLLRGSWQVEGFAAAAPSGSASAIELDEAAKTGEAQSVTVTYTGDHIELDVPGQPMLRSSYDVVEDTPSRVKIKNGPEYVVITFKDDDHMTVDRQGNAYGAKMNMRRVATRPNNVARKSPPPSASALASLASARPGQKTTVIVSPTGTIVKIGP